MKIRIAAALLVSAPAFAQWSNYPTPGIPRSPDGKPNLSAPTPKTADGKPDMSGVWLTETEYRKYAFNLVADLKPSDFQPWAQALAQQRRADSGQVSPASRCIPGPIMGVMGVTKILQAPDVVLMMYEFNDNNWRQIFLDGRKLPEDPNPIWMGYSVGHWEADTLVVETAGFNDKTWMDYRGGYPHTESLRVTERYRRQDFGHLDLQITLDDPKAFTKPFTIPASKRLLADTELMETICTENEQDWKHLVAK